MRNFRLVLGLLTGLTISSGTSLGSTGMPRCDTWKGEWQESTVFFGKSTKNDRAISRQALDKFVQDVILPTFPHGFTLIETTGYWYSSKLKKTIYENGFQLVVLHPSKPEEHQKFDRIAKLYVNKFEQDSVLMSRHAAEPRECKKPKKD